MKIDQHTPSLNSGPPAAAVASPKARAGPTAPRTPAASDPARSASLTSLRSADSGDFDTARVERIRQRISEGSYQVNTGKIADGLLSTVHDLLGRKPS